MESPTRLAPPPYTRYVALGDSSTEGLDDPRPEGGFRGWADRLAERLAHAYGSVLYANLGVRGRRTRQILDEQLAPALAMRPDLVTLFTGTNDVVARRFEAAAVLHDIETMHLRLIAAGATVITFTLPDLSGVMPLARPIAPRIAQLNDGLRRVAGGTGALLVDMAAHPVALDSRIWSEDRLHANPEGHRRIAQALAHALRVPGADASWSTPLPDLPRASRWHRAAREVAWLARHFGPWAWRHLRGRSSGDGRGPKRPTLGPWP